MQVREAVEADAEALAAIADAPVEVLRNVVHDRSVRIAETDAASGPHEDVDGDEDADHPLGFLSFDVRGGTVHITQYGGTREACAALLAEPVRFAERERFTVEVLVTDDDEAMREALEEVGFEQTGAGPAFQGQPTERYRYDP